MSSSSRPHKPQSTLDAFISSRKNPISDPVFTSREIHDRGSVFVANIYHANTQQEAKARVDQMKAIVHSAKPATHEMSAWRCMVPKPGRSGLSGPEDFELQSGSKDDGERWAGGKILNVMETLGIIDAVVIVSRWYVDVLLSTAPLPMSVPLGMEASCWVLPVSLISRSVPWKWRGSSKTRRSWLSLERCSKHWMIFLPLFGKNTSNCPPLLRQQLRPPLTAHKKPLQRYLSKSPTTRPWTSRKQGA